MFATLVESRAARGRSGTASVVSVVAHTLGIAGALIATHRAATASLTGVVEPVIYTAPAPEPPPAATTRAARPVLPRGFRLLLAPISIPDVLPAIDLAVPLTNADYFTGRGMPGGHPNGAAPADTGGRALRSDEVEKLATLVPGTATPAYPDVLRAVRIEGDVVIEFVVDTLGRAELAGLQVVSSTNPRFTESVLRAMTTARFLPAEAGGARVRQLVRLPFAFSLK